MKKFWVDFLKRGSMFAWCGPVVLCIVWACLKLAGVIEVIEAEKAVLAVLSTILIAFIAAGITAVYQLEFLPKGMAALIQMLVLYLDYLIIYLVNGWMPVRVVGVFTVLFAVGFGIIWAVIYFVTKGSVEKLNAKLEN